MSPEAVQPIPTNMFGFLKNLLHKSQGTRDETEYEGAPEESAPEAAPEPQRTHSTHPNSRPGPARKPGSPQNGKGVEISLQNILNNLPLELQPRVRQPDVGDMSISVPLEKILAQLSRGAVKVSFGELRQAAPDVFTEENDRDRVLVPLPLADILSRLNPALITRRRVQRQIEVPSDISSPFDQSGQGLVFSVGPGKPEAEPAPISPPRHSAPPTAAPVTHAAPPARRNLASVPPAPVAPSAPFAPNRQKLTPAPKPVPPASAPISMAPRAAAPAPAPIPTATRAPAPASAPIPMATRAPAPAPAPISMAPRTPAPLPVAPPAPIAASSAAPQPRDSNGHEPQAQPTPPSQPAKPAVHSEPLIISLTALAEAWPESVRKEIVELNLVETKIALPGNAVEQALKQGRISFSWKTLRSWIKPAVLQTTSAQDGTVLELPLKVVAPLFLARQQEGASHQQKVAVDEDIPNLFFGFPRQETGVPVAAATARPADTNFYVWDENSDTARVDESDNKRAASPSPGTKFVAKYATPNEVVSRASGLDGVTGALIALPDGLMVANRLPPELNADTLAAFLPQIFGKVSQCTKELRMGELNNLNFTVGDVPWKIFRVNSIFFAAFGKAGEPLPTAQLAALAAELDHKPR
jgi:predicted regulator of Ras-like GTPase activity (Roadblock/LC7/MglB family)